jgi:hypothetical protein
MSNIGSEEKPKSILLKDVPNEIWLKICEVKNTIRQNNKGRDKISHQEAIYKLIRNNCA